MSFIDELSVDLANINADLVADFGTRVSVYRVTQTKRADNSPAKSYSAEPTLVDVAIDVLEPMVAAKRNVFGLTSKAEMFLLFPTQDGVLPTINLGDGVKFTSGPYEGRSFVADDKGAADAQGINLGVSIVEAPAGTVMA